MHRFPHMECTESAADVLSIWHARSWSSLSFFESCWLNLLLWILLLIGSGVDIIDLVTLAVFRIMLSLHHLNARPKKVFKCRRVGRKRCRLHRKCIRKPRVSLFNRVGRFLSFCVRAQFCSFCQNMPEHSQASPPRSSFRGTETAARFAEFVERYFAGL